MGQVIFYRWKNGDKNKLLVDETTRLLDDENNDASEGNIEIELIVPKDPARTRRTVRMFAFLSILLSAALVLGSAYYFFGMEEKADVRQLHVLPQILGYASALLYCVSRVPQIMHNFRNESVEGLSLWMFVFSVAGNVTYCVVSYCFTLGKDRKSKCKETNKQTNEGIEFHIKRDIDCSLFYFANMFIQ